MAIEGVDASPAYRQGLKVFYKFTVSVSGESFQVNGLAWVSRQNLYMQAHYETLQKMRLILILRFSSAFLGCSLTKNGLTKKRIVMNKSYRNVYSIEAPVGGTGISKIFGGHGQSFSINYNDGSFIYYTDDMYVATPIIRKAMDILLPKLMNGQIEA